MKQLFCFLFVREELKEQLEKKKKGSRALADFEDKMNDVCFWLYKWFQTVFLNCKSTSHYLSARSAAKAPFFQTYMLF